LSVVSCKLIIATGSAPSCLPGLSFDHERFLCSDDALEFARKNARLNGASLAELSPLDWRQPYAGEPFELVLASDVLYERRNVEPVGRWLRAALAPGGTALVADTNRGSAEGFADAAGALGLCVNRVPRELTGPHGLLIRGAIYRLGRPDFEGEHKVRPYDESEV
jgi:SAM-dependent methyltransferase